MKISDYGYVADRWQHDANGRRVYTGTLGGSGWMVVRHTERGFEDGPVYSSKRAAFAALTQAFRADAAASQIAATLGARGGRAGRGESKRRNVDYAALGRKGGRAGKGASKARHK